MIKHLNTQQKVVAAVILTIFFMMLLTQDLSQLEIPNNLIPW